jgi:hypothetical protein
MLSQRVGPWGRALVALPLTSGHADPRWKTSMRLAPGPVAAIGTAGRSTRGQPADITDQRLDVRRLRLVATLYLAREEFRTAALTLGFKPAALRQWRHRRAIPPRRKTAWSFSSTTISKSSRLRRQCPRARRLPLWPRGTSDEQATRARSPGLSAVPGETLAVGDREALPKTSSR